MQQLGTRLVNGAVWCLALALIGCGLFLQQDEQGQIENRLDLWWHEANVRRQQSGSLLAAFVCTVCAYTGHFLTAVFGPRLVSARGALVSICATIASINAVLFYRNPLVLSRPVMIVIVIALIAWASDYYGRRLWAAVTFLAATIGALAYQWIWWHYAQTWPMPPALDMLTFGTFPERIADTVFLILLASTLSNVAIIAGARWLLTTVETGISLPRAFELVVLGGAVPLLLVGAPLWGPRWAAGDIRAAAHQWLLVATEYFGYANLPAAMVPLLIVALASAMLLHRLLWGAVQRPLYAVGAKFHVFKDSHRLLGAGIGLLSLEHPRVAAAVHAFLLG